MVEEEGGSLPVVVLAAIDGGTESERVVETAAAYARGQPNAELHLLHVVEAAPRDPDIFDAVSDRALAIAHAILERSSDFARASFGGNVTEHLAFGTAWQEVIDVAGSVRADLVVVGTHDRTGLERLMLGSVAAKVTQKAPCAVLVARPRSSSLVHVQGDDAEPRSRWSSNLSPRRRAARRHAM